VPPRHPHCRVHRFTLMLNLSATCSLYGLFTVEGVEAVGASAAG
jgi:hypothetical protein